MFAFAAAVLFLIALVFALIGFSAGGAVTATVLITAGLFFLAVQVMTGRRARVRD